MSQSNNGDRMTRPSISRKGYGVHAQLVPVSTGGVHKIPVGLHPVIPIVFLPGIMGSNLLNTNTGEIVWEPDESTDTLWRYSGASGEERQRYLDMTATEVYRGGGIRVVTAEAVSSEGLTEEDVAGFESEVALRDRGWGEIMGSAYHTFMLSMQTALNSVFASGAVNPLWNTRKNLPLRAYGMSQGMSPLTDDELRNLAQFRFDVWACGYNWLRSNAEAADRVKELIKTRIFPAYANHQGVRLAAEKVILVTHSMGGLVARRLCADEEGKNLVLGVVHGAQPCNGAGESYTNMRQGVQGDGSLAGDTKADILGNSTETLAPVFSQCQGGLELLPFGFGSSYNPSPRTMRLTPPAVLSSHTAPGIWLFMRQHKGWEFRLLPCFTTDVYEQIYKSPEWYGLLPRHNERFFDPAGILRRNTPDKNSREIFEEFIGNVKKFHKSIVRKYHPATYSFWGAGEDTPATGEALWEWQWTREAMRDGWRNEDVMRTREEDNGRGEYITGPDRYTLQCVRHSGDGTVPRASWENDRHAPGMLGYCCLGASKEDPRGFGHQDAFKDRRAQEACLFFLAKLVSNKLAELKP